MAAVNLPDNPANGTTQTVGGITYTYNSSKGYWTTASSGTATTQVVTSDSAPSSPADGDLWYDTDYGGMFVYYADGTSNQWVEVIGTQGAQGTLQTSDSAPSNPSDGDLWYDTDDGGLFIYYSDGTSNQWVEVVGQTGPAGPTGATGAAGSTTVVANTTALLAISSPSAGDMAYVSGNNTLYFYNGSGWYKIALINATPSISGVNASYALAIDGTATTVTVVASDPEGLPVTYSIASDTSGNIATVTQGTGSSTNVFTITPSTNSAHAGTFSLTFRASDGVNFATAASSFTLQFQVQNSRYTTALVTSTGANGAQNANTFDDASTSNHTLTRTLALQTSFSPYRPGGYSQYFDGSGDYIKISDNTAHDFGTGDFSMEFWWHPDTVTGNSGNIHIMISAPNNSHNQFIYHESNYWYYASGSGGATVIPSSTGAATANAWNHVVLCRSGTTMSIFSNGTRTATVQSSAAVDFSNATIGRYDSGGYEIDGYLRDMRWLKGSSAYDATQTSITVPTEPLTAVTNTTLLLFNTPYQRDVSSTNASLLCYGHLKAVGFSPYDSGLEYDTAVHGGSINCTKDGAAVHVADSDDFTFGSGDWTIEFWTYRTAGTGSDYQAVIAGVGSWAIEFMSSNRLSAWFSSGSSGSWDLLNQGTLGHADGSSGNNWIHFAVQRSGNYLVTYQNGVQTDSRSFTGTIGNPTAINIGYYNGNLNDMTGFISDLHVIKGTAKYSANFIPPTQRISLHSNTKLSVPATEAGIIDKSQALQYIDCYNGVASSTTQTKYYNSSIYFDGSNDYLQLSDPENLPGAFTIEMWMYVPTGSISQSDTFLTIGTTGTSANCMLLYRKAADNKIAIWNSGSTILTSSTAIPQGQWAHLAITRNSSNTINIWIDGVDKGSVSNTNNFIPGTHGIKLGAENPLGFYYIGYMSDVRITKGLARYTSNFTAPTAALKG